MKNNSGSKPECIECKNYHLYYDRQKQNYTITSNILEAFDNGHWIDLRAEKISNLIKLLQNHESNLINN